ncbi:MAG: CPBP family intramembrane metalloprotease [Moorea sp. SIOASIH]|uniref:type II CAAX endopeptidase family protein n=1 Tax=Moorena sp. SIOASIH TaxID=2607817 RepID=UPI0013B786E1|nr:type II CAAX endopeptidase family protein [Moorena sp. SIOASIH]NEO36974.1 CPBP family intramembrane metalloprotease [Moorena sp. SIOASIH]
MFILALLSLWLPIAAPIYLIGRDPNSVTILTMGLMFGVFLYLVRVWGRKVYRQPGLLKKYGLQLTAQNALELIRGLGLGLLMTLSLFGLQGWLGWLAFQTPPLPWSRLIVEGLISALAIGFAEELVFRGWLLDELQRDYSFRTSQWIGAIAFALLHFLKPIPEMIRSLPRFPSLLLLGLILIWAKRSTQGRLGLSIGFHAGLVWGYYIIDVGQLVLYSGKVAPWITGINRDPTAGIMGLLFLALVAWWMKRNYYSD